MRFKFVCFFMCITLNAIFPGDVFFGNTRFGAAGRIFLYTNFKGFISYKLESNDSAIIEVRMVSSNGEKVYSLMADGEELSGKNAEDEFERLTAIYNSSSNSPP